MKQFFIKYSGISTDRGWIVRAENEEKAKNKIKNRYGVYMTLSSEEIKKMKDIKEIYEFDDPNYEG